MMETQQTLEVQGLVPEKHEAKFVAQHLSAYAFAQKHARGGTVLEIGFGEGYGANFLARAAKEVFAVDTAPGNPARAAARYNRPNLHFLHTDGRRLDFPNGSFNLVCSFQVIEHIPEKDLDRYLSEIVRVLKPGGAFCVSTLNLENNLKYKPGRSYEKNVHHHKEFTASELEALLKRFFGKVDLRGLHLTPKHRVFQRFKRWGLNRIGPARINPVARFYQSVGPKDFHVLRRGVRRSLDLVALCTK